MGPVCCSVQEGSPRLRSVSISGRGRVMRLLFWDKLEPFVMVINRNRRCKPKFILRFLVRSFYDQFSDRHCRSIRRLLPWITAFCCHFVMPLITTVQVPAILYVLRLPRYSVIGSFRRRHPSISLRHWRLIRSLFQRDSKLKDSRVRGRSLHSGGSEGWTKLVLARFKLPNTNENVVLIY